MSRPAITAAAFALNAGEPCDARSVLHVDPVPDGAGRRLLISVEPLEPSRRGYELARLALATLREGYAEASGQPPAVALTRAFAAANAALVAENRPLAGCRWERRVYVGATAAVVTRRTLTIAQVPATQAIVVQDGQLYAFPDLASWCCDYVPTTDQPEPDPLGWREGTRPRLVHTLASPGDLILLCSSPLAARLARDAAAGAASAEPLLGGNLEAALDHLGEVAAAHALDDAHAAAVLVDRRRSPLGGRWATGAGHRSLGAGWSPGPRLAVPPLRRALGSGGPAAGTRGAVFAARDPWTGLGIPLDSAPPLAVSQGTRSTDPAREVGVAPVPPAVVAAPAPWSPPRAAIGGGAGGPRPRLGERLRLGLVGLAERLTPRRGPSQVTLGARRAALTTPGAGSMHRYTGQAAVPIEWRATLPRGPKMPVSGRFLTLSVVAFLAFGGSGFAVDRHRDQTARAAAALTAADGYLRAATDTGAGDAIARAEAALVEARRAGAPAAALAQRQHDLDAARDRAWAVDRFAAVLQLGALPSELVGRPVRLALAGQDLYLVGGGLYGFDAGQRRLVRLLEPGTPVGDGRVGQLREVAVDGATLVVSDGSALYARDGGGRWTRRPLGQEGDSPRPAMPTAAFQESFYALEPEGGRILKFAAGDLGAPPLTWVDAGIAPELIGARDLAIDGRVHVLLADGRILTFFRGAVEAELVPALSPPAAKPIALDGGDDALYVADSGVEIGAVRGRIVRLDAAGNARQLLAPIPDEGDAAAGAAAEALGEARDAVVDEAAGVVYVVTDRALWRAVLPRPATPA